MNCSTPLSTMNAWKASMNLRRSGVWSRYDFQSVDTATEVSDDEDDGFEDDFGPAMLKVLKLAATDDVDERNSSKQRQPAT